ncbi:hypothetical protein [Nostoc sp.]
MGHGAWGIERQERQGRVRILDFRFWIKELKFNPKSSIPSPKGRRYANGLVQSLMGSHCGRRERLHKASGVETPCFRAASPKSKIELPNAQSPMPHAQSPMPNSNYLDTCIF